jgi:dihydroorotase
MLLTNAQWLSPEGLWQKGSIVIEAGRIAELSPIPEPTHIAGPQIDCSGLLVFPGGIDAHVHFREPGIVAKEGIVNGCFAAAKGGVTTILDMPNTIPPCCSRREFDSKRQLFSEKAPVNWGLFFDVSVLGNASKWPDAERPAGKLYMAKSSPARPVNDAASVAKIFSDYRLVAIHAEDENALVANEKIHHMARPRKSVVAALHTIEKAWGMASRKPRIVLCHIGTTDEIEWVKHMRARGADIVAETCPHYLVLTQDDYLAQGNIYKVNPPIREERDKQALLEALRDGTISILSTDHAPHLLEEKNSDKPPSGIAGIEWYYPIALHIKEVSGISWQRFHELVCGNAAHSLGFAHRDGIKVGNFADLAIFEANKSSNAEPVVTKAGTRPFAQFPLSHVAKHVFTNGNLVIENGTFNAAVRGLEVLNANAQGVSYGAASHIS